MIKLWAFAVIAAAIISCLVQSDWPYRILSAMETPNRTGSWDTIPIFVRSQCRFKDFKSVSSSKIYSIKLLL